MSTLRLFLFIVLDQASMIKNAWLTWLVAIQRQSVLITLLG